MDEKKVYSTPQLLDYGNIEDLTQNGKGNPTDGNTGNPGSNGV